MDSRVTWKNLGLRKQIKPKPNLPWYIFSKASHDDLNISYLSNIINEKSITHHDKMTNHTNALFHPLLDPFEKTRL